MTQIHFCFILGKIKLSKHLQGHKVKFSAAAEAEHLLALGPSPGSLWEGVNWNISSLLGGLAKSAHQI